MASYQSICVYPWFWGFTFVDGVGYRWQTKGKHWSSRTWTVKRSVRDSEIWAMTDMIAKLSKIRQIRMNSVHYLAGSAIDLKVLGCWWRLSAQVLRRSFRAARLHEAEFKKINTRWVDWIEFGAVMSWKNMGTLSKSKETTGRASVSFKDTCMIDRVTLIETMFTEKKNLFFHS